MDHPIYRDLKIGIVHFKAFPECVNGSGPIVETLGKICEDDFFTAVEVGAIKDVKQRTEAAKVLEISGLDVAYACQPTLFPNKLSLNHLEPGERKKALNAVKNCLKEAHDLGATAVRIPAGKDPGPEKRGEAKRLLIDSLAQILETAKKMGGPLITLKLFDRAIDKESLIGPAEDALEIAEALCPEYENFGLLTDLSHFPLLGEDPRTTLTLLVKYVKAFHIGNCLYKDPLDPLYGDLQPRFGVPGGEIGTPEVRDYFRVLKDLELIGPEKRPVVSAEVRPLLPLETSELIIANCKRTIREAWALA
ncbi:MAG: sugar phosphate isomerase/epimerase [Gracilibacteraceae bacterium]|jgi:sugar phosphate isomerase/epimerase|nr:sugar phosphate isomerase/epimerase [Gracilibacteraceae bacterium]